MAKLLCTGVGRILLVVLLSISAAQAAVIEYSVTSTGADTWRYDYTINNTSGNVSFDEFTVYFDWAKVTALSLYTTPTGWDNIVIQPDPALPAAGYVDSVSLAGLIPAGSVFSGFSVDFSYLSGLTPGAQAFDLVLSNPFETVYSGVTVAAPGPNPIPEPNTYALMLLSLCVMAVGSRAYARRTVHLDRGNVTSDDAGEQA